MAAGAVPLFPEPELPWEPEPWDEDVAEPAEGDGLEDDLRGPPAEALGWWEALSAAERVAWCDELEALPVCPDPDAEWFAAGSRDAGVPAGVSVFSAEEAGDRLGPGRVLAELSEQA
ncbi:MAG TPA: hypothetical protein VF843_05440, partial [Streptosporangiaceae bacterium]